MKKFFDKQLLQNVYENFETFKKSPEALPFRYPCQGVGRFEYMLPFAPPFNTSIVYQDRRLHDILFEFLQSRFKLELQTIITSEPGAGFQRFHQGHQGLFHPSERLPPYAVVVGVTLFLKIVFIVVRIFEKKKNNSKRCLWLMSINLWVQLNFVQERNFVSIKDVMFF